MTDNEIIKALEEIKKGCWANGDFYTVIENAIDLINRQKAEIEKWQGGYMTQKVRVNEHGI